MPEDADGKRKQRAMHRALPVTTGATMSTVVVVATVAEPVA
ncbi:hypothetical protein [Trinickia terrae]|nr:hypothetical protein [Trinickia terrae]